MNKSDSEIIAGLLTEEGLYSELADPNLADILIFNSCAIRENAENRVFNRMQEFNHKRKKKSSNQIIVLAGCIPQYEKENILKKYPFINLIIGPNTFEFLPQLLSQVNSQSALHLAEKKNTNFVSKTILRTSNDQAWIPIMYGCDNFCSYCIVPYTRGREASRKKEDIFKEIEQLKDTKYSKIMLLGQNVNSYGKNLYDNYDFADLITDIQKLDHIRTIDFLTSHPKDMTSKLILTLANNSKVGREIHFPLQAGDDEILKAMNRHYTYAQYKALVEEIRKHIPNAYISTDLIVGFPGETEEQFQNSIKAVKELSFYRVISSAYSPRKGTVAASMPNQIDKEEKHRRLLLLQGTISKFAFAQKK